MVSCLLSASPHQPQPPEVTRETQVRAGSLGPSPVLIKCCEGVREAEPTHTDLHLACTPATCNSPQPQPALQTRKKYDQAS